MKLIDADKLINSIQHELWDWESVDGIASSTVLKQTISDIKNEPIIDAVPVRHGKWTADETLYTQGMVVCSCCNADYYRDDLYMVGYAMRELPKYCPYCGAKMKGADDE